MFFFIPSNENGVIIDPYAAENLRAASSAAIQDIFIYSHGWWTSAVDAMISYNRFAAGLSCAASLPPASLAVGIHWPSMLSENHHDWLNLAECASFFTMEQRAEHVGRHGVYHLLRWILEGRATSPLRIHLLGHSFGCKVICSALSEFIETSEPEICRCADFNLILLQAAIEDDALSPTGRYKSICSLPHLRILSSKSSQDTALCAHFKRAHTVEFFDHEDRIALGAEGPNLATINSFGGAANLILGSPGCTYKASNSGRWFVADLSTIHRQRAAGGLYKPTEFAGQHSDIYFAELYQLIGEFMNCCGIARLSSLQAARPSSPYAQIPLPVDA